MALATAALANEDSKLADQNKQNQANQENANQQNTAQPTNQQAQQEAKQNQGQIQSEEQKNVGQSEHARQSADEERQNQIQRDQTPNTQNTSGKSPAPQRYDSRGNSNQAAGNVQRGQKGRSRGNLGVSIAKSDEASGVTVMQIMPNTAAERMGLQRRDRITSVNGEPVRSVDDLISQIGNMSPGDSIELQVTRNGNQRTVRGELAGYSESVVETQGPSGTRAYRQFKSYIAPDQSNAESERNGREGSAQDSRNVTSYNERGGNDRTQSGDLESRISRIEQQIERLSDEINRLSSQSQSQSAQRNVSPNAEKK
jgi:hypothetical protein